MSGTSLARRAQTSTAVDTDTAFGVVHMNVSWLPPRQRA
jgi:hypothetical protein